MAWKLYLHGKIVTIVYGSYEKAERIANECNEFMEIDIVYSEG